jgi:REP element-mobilizing transposase RayT
MILNEAGKMIKNQWHALPQRFKNIALDEYIVMPDHFHGMIIINDPRRDKSRIHPKNESPFSSKDNHHYESRIHSKNESPLQSKGEYKIRPDSHPKGTTDGSIGRIIQAFKSITTYKYIIGVKQNGWESFPGKLWQRNYYEHVIRDELGLNRIRQYIVNNPG